MATVASIVESSKVRIVEKLRAEAFQRFAHDAELEAFEQELRFDLQQRGSQLSWDTARVELEQACGIVVDRSAPHRSVEARSTRPYLINEGDLAAGSTFFASHPRSEHRPAESLETPDSCGVQALSPLPNISNIVRPSNPSPHCLDDDGDDFGDDLPPLRQYSTAMESPFGSRASSRRPSIGSEGPGGPMAAAWHLKSQQPWQQGAEHCTLTILENSCEALIQFEMVRNRTGAKMVLTCSHAQFDELCAEQTGLSGAAQINAAIAQMFREAVEEIEKPGTLSDDTDEFGEDIGGEFAHLATSRPSMAPEAGIRWHIKSQQPWQCGCEQCSLTILENSLEGLVQFELLKLSTNTTMNVTCTDAQWDTLLKEQVGLSGASQTHAAIHQLFNEAHEEIEQPKELLDRIAEFGEDSGDESHPAVSPAPIQDGSAPETRWHIKSQQPWQLGLEHCTLTILENTGEGLVQFELVKNSTNATMHVTCSNAQFNGILQEQTGLFGAAQTNAAISQLFREAHEEIQKPAYGLDPVDEFGEDFGEEFAGMAFVAPPASPGATSEHTDVWHVKAQQPWQLGLEHCMLTISENAAKDRIQFELIKNSSQVSMQVTCTSEQFDGLLKEQSGLRGVAQTNAAIEQLFREAQEEIARPDAMADAEEDFGEDIAAEFCARPSSKANAEALWHIKSQQPWQMHDQQCTLTILENAGEGLVQFELMKLSSGNALYVTCTDEQFDDVLAEQTFCTGTARVNAAISQLFHEAHEEVGEPSTRRDSLGSLGVHDVDNMPGTMASPQGEAEQHESRWLIQSQQPWQFGQEHCTLTILENKGDGLLQFELVKLRQQTMVHVMCTNAQFDELCKQQTGLRGTAQTNAALAQLFREAHEDVQEES